MAKKSRTGVVAAEVGAGLAAVGAAAAASYYFYASKDAKKNRKIAAKWTTGMKNKVVRQVKRLPKVDAATVAVAVDTAVAAYENLRSIDRADLDRAAKELKANWELVRAEVKRSAKSRPKRAIVRKKSPRRPRTHAKKLR